MARGAAFINDGSISGGVVVSGAAGGSGTFGRHGDGRQRGHFRRGGHDQWPVDRQRRRGGGSFQWHTLTARGGVVNNGTIRLAHGASLAVPSAAPVAGTETDSMTGGVVTVAIDGYAGPACQLQRNDSSGGGTFTHPGSPQGF